MVSLNDIRSRFAGMRSNTASEIPGLESPYRAWLVYTNEKIGAAVPCDSVFEQGFYAQFSEVKIEYVKEMRIGSEKYAVLFLYVVHNEVMREELSDFASICAGFIDPGINGEKRRNLVNNPKDWWFRMRHIVGNRSVDMQIYSIVGELIIYDYLLQQHKNGISWTGNKKSRVDFMTGKETYEVKTTLQRYGSTITVHGQFQLAVMKKDAVQKLEFCRLEENPDKGISVNNLLARLGQHGEDNSAISNVLTKMGFPPGSLERQKTFSILEIREYDVDSHFPAITNDSFVNGKLPDGIVRIDYSVDLENLPYRSLTYTF